jgi:ribonuclease D
MFKESITKEELTDLPLQWFEGKIVVVDKPEQVKGIARLLASYPVIGFDTETRPAFKKGKTNKVALLQLSTPDQAFLFRVNKIGLPKEIRKILANPEIIKPGVAIRDDIKGLKEINHFEPDGFIELQDFAKELGIQNFSLKKLAAITCNFRISKSQQLSNWEADSLTDAQQVYAATDAWVSLKIYENFAKN